MGRYKTLLSNTIIFALSDFSAKIITFFMLPFYTSAMTTGDFGASDLITSTVGILIPIFTLSIAGGSLRFVMKNETDNCQIFSFGLKVVFTGFAILLLLFPIWAKIEIIKDYLLLFYLTYLASSINNYFNLFARGINKTKLVGICGVLGTVIVVISNIILLLVLHMGVEGYLISFIISYAVCSTVLFIGGDMHRFLTTAPCEKLLRMDLLSYSIPLVPTALSWWLNNAANRYIIVEFCGVAQVGLFAAAARIPMILITLQGVFVQAWELSAYSEYEKEGREQFYQDVYENINLLSLFFCSILIMSSQLISSLLFSPEFLNAWQYSPLLLVSTMFGALSGVLGTVFSLVNKTKMLFITTLLGGIVAVGCNYMLVPVLGPMGASWSSVISYLTIWSVRYITSIQYIKMVRHPYRDLFSYLLLIIQAVSIIYINGTVGYLVAFLFCILMVIVNRNDIIRNIKYVKILVISKISRRFSLK